MEQLAQCKKGVRGWSLLALAQIVFLGSAAWFARASVTKGPQLPWYGGNLAPISGSRIVMVKRPWGCVPLQVAREGCVSSLTPCFW